MKNMNDCLFILGWYKSKIQRINQKQVQTNSDDQKFIFNE